MIQRIQTLYFGIAMILLGIVTAGVEMFSFVTESSRYEVSAFGITESSKESEVLLSHTSYPMFIGTIALILLCFLAIMSYKNLDRQLKLGRIIFGLYFLGVIGVLVLTMIGEQLIGTKLDAREMGLGFILFIAGFPFTFLANLGIKRDKRLLDSLDRLR